MEWASTPTRFPADVPSKVCGVKNRGWDEVDLTPEDHPDNDLADDLPWHMATSIVEDGEEDLPRRKKHARSPIPGEQAGLD